VRRAGTAPEVIVHRTLAIKPARSTISREQKMDYFEQLDALQQRVVATRTAVQAATAESREQLGQRIDQAQAELDRSVKDTPQSTEQPAGGPRAKWTQMKADAAAKMDNAKAKFDKRNRQMDADTAATGADWAEADAADALDFAGWAVNNAQVAMLDAIDARAYAQELATAARS